MKTPVFIGCDIGTSGTKAVAVDKYGTILAQASVTYGIIQLHNNWAEQDPDIWLCAASDTIQKVVKELPDTGAVASICISALYGGTGAMCDKDMNPVRPSLIWMDRRAKDEGEMLARTIGRDHIFQVSGNGTDSYFGYTKLVWVKNHEPENWRKIRYILPIHSYIVCKMTGKVTVDYCSAGNVGGIYDYRSHCWSEEMCRKMGIPFDALPHSFFRPDEIIGTLNEEFRQKLGFSHAVSVCAGTVDCIASMLSAGITTSGDNATVLGTSLNWGYIHSNLPDNPSLVSMPYCIHPEKMSYTYGGASTAGALPRWFALKFVGNDHAGTYEDLERQIYESKIGPGADGLIALPYFMGERTPVWDEKAAGVLFGLTLSHTKAHIYRAILEAVAYSLRHIMETMTAPDTSIRKVILVGGGARSAIWKQIFADVTGLAICTPTQEIEAPLGDAFMAAMSFGALDDYSVIHDWITMNPPIEPDPKAHDQYNRYYQIYKKLYPNLKNLMHERADMLSESAI